MDNLTANSSSEMQASAIRQEDNETCSSVSSIDLNPSQPVDTSQDQDIRQQSTSQLTLTQQETSSKSRFIKIPKLNELFTIVNWDNRNRTSTCNFCGELVKSNRSARNVNHIKRQCKKIPEVEKEAFLASIERVDESANLGDDRLHFLITKVIINNNAPFKMAECPYFIKLIKYLNRKARPVSRHDVSSKYLSRLALEAEKVFFNQIKQGRNYTLSIEFDHWKDISKKLIIGVVVTMLEGSSYLLNLKDVSLGGHFSSIIVETLADSLNKIPPRFINSFISDSASTCRRAKRDLVKKAEFKHIIVQRCIAHFLNLIIKEFMKDPATKSTIDAAIKVASYASNDSALLAKLSASGLKRISKSTSVRWYSTVNMLESELDAKQELEDHLKMRPGERENKAKRLARRLVSRSFWAHVFQIIGAMRPLVNCIAIAERANGSLGEAMREIINFVRSLLNADWNDKFAIAALKAFFSYFNTEKLDLEEVGVMLAAYFIDRRFKMDYIAPKGIELVLETIGMLASQSGFPPENLNLILYAEFKNFIKQRAPFNQPAAEEQTALQWWSDMPDLGVLKEIAIRLASLKSSSANTERLFSVLKIFQSPVRTNFNIETLRDAARVKLSLGRNESDSCIYQNLAEYNSEMVYELSSQSSISSSLSENVEGDESQRSQSRSFSGTQAPVSPTVSTASQERRRRSLPTHVVLQICPETTFLDAVRSNDEDGLRDRLEEAYNAFKQFRDWFDFSVVNDLVAQEGRDEPDGAFIQAEIDEMKRRFRMDMDR